MKRGFWSELGPAALVGLGMVGATLLARADAVSGAALLGLALVAADAWDRRLRGARSPIGPVSSILAIALVGVAYIAGPGSAVVLGTLSVGAWAALIPGEQSRPCRARAERGP